MASIIYIKYGITTDQKWFDTHVRDVLKEEYPEELAESTYSYMKIPKKYNKLIVEHKGRQLQEGKLDFLEYLNMYKKISQEMRKIDKDGLLLCDLQGLTFELSIELTSTSSEIFMVDL